MAFPKLNPQIVYAHRKPVSVILSIEAFEALLNHVEELEDIQAVQQALKEPMDTVAFEDHLREVREKLDKDAEAETAYLLQSEEMKRRLIEAKNRDTESTPQQP